MERPSTLYLSSKHQKVYFVDTDDTTLSLLIDW